MRAASYCDHTDNRLFPTPHTWSSASARNSSKAAYSQTRPVANAHTASRGALPYVLHVRGNPLKYSDPTGHYSDEEIMRHYGCADWTCVEAIFGAGGAMDGMRGWLFILMAAQNGDAVSMNTTSKLDGQNTFNWTQGTIQFQGGNFTVHDVVTRVNQSNSPMSWSSMGGDTFATFAFLNNNTEMFGDFYFLSGPNHTAASIDETRLDCRHIDCFEYRLNQASNAASGVTIGCALVTLGTCAAVAGWVSTGIGAVSLTYTGYKAAVGERSAMGFFAEAAGLGAGYFVGRKVGGKFGESTGALVGEIIGLTSNLAPK